MRANASAAGGSEGRGMWFGLSGGVLESATLLPIQFHDIWSRSGAASPARSLALAVVQEALNDLVRHRFAKGRRGQRMYWQAYAWIADDDREWPFSFANLCDSVGLPIELIRDQLLRPLTLPGAAAAGPGPEPEAILGKAA